MKDFPYGEIFSSTEMTDYFKYNPPEPEKLVEAIQGEPISLAHKLQLLTIFDETKYLCVVSIQQLMRAIEEMNTKPGELFLLKCCRLEESVNAQMEQTDGIIAP